MAYRGVMAWHQLSSSVASAWLLWKRDPIVTIGASLQRLICQLLSHLCGEISLAQLIGGAVIMAVLAKGESRKSGVRKAGEESRRNELGSCRRMRRRNQPKSEEKLEPESLAAWKAWKPVAYGESSGVKGWRKRRNGFAEKNGYTKMAKIMTAKTRRSEESMAGKAYSAIGEIGYRRLANGEELGLRTGQKHGSDISHCLSIYYWNTSIQWYLILQYETFSNSMTMTHSIITLFCEVQMTLTH